MFSQIVVLALAALPFVAQPAMASSCTRTYTVKEGDFCDAISAAQNVSTYQLYVTNIQSVNAECSNLWPGQSLCLGTSGEDCTTTYVVKPDDTCELITGIAGINSTMLYLNNPQINEECSNIYVGQVLCSAKTVLVPAAPGGLLGIGGQSSSVAPAAPATYATASTSTVKHTSTSSKAPAETAKSGSGSLSSGSGSSSSSGSSDGGDGDDDNLPWCDEL